MKPAILVAIALLVPRAIWAQTAPPGSGQAPAPAAPAETKRIFIDVGLLGLADSLGHSRTFTGSVIKFSELASLGATYSEPSNATLAPAVDVGGGFMLMPQFALGANFNRVTYESTAALSATIPHPVLFNVLAHGTGAASSPLARHEATTTIFAAWAPSVGSRMQVRLFGGPAYFSYTAEMVKEPSYTQDAQVSPPSNAITINGSVNQQVTGHDLGYQVGVDVAYFFTKMIGISGGLRYSRGTVTIDEPISRVHQQIRVGSATLLLGVRLRIGK